MVKKIIIDTLKSGKEVAFRYDRGNSFHADTLINELPEEPNWIHVRHSQSSNSRLINLAVVQRVVIED
jgi:hypothetical protein|nr:MAG TPA: hypothetical protein [Caudoviricetes sp.]